MDTTEKKKASPVPKIILGLILLVGGYFLFTSIRFSQTHETTDNAQVEANLVPAIARIGGYVRNVYVRDYAQVRKGDTLLTIDPAEFQIAIAQAEADLAQAQADIANARAQVGAISANVNVARANEQAAEVRLTKASADLNRDAQLFKEASITRRQLDDTRSNLDNNQKAITVAKNQIMATSATQAGASALIRRAEAVLKAREAALDNARLRLSYTTVIAPISGKTGKNSLAQGQYLNSGTILFNIVDDSKHWVVANFKETQLKHLREGKEVMVKLDAYPDATLKGKIVSLSDATGAKFSLLPPDNSTGNFVKITQRLPVKIAIEDEGELKGKLRAGLSVEVESENE